MAGIHGANDIVGDGLILHMDPANPRCYSGSGSVCYDLSNSKLIGTLYNSPTYSTSNNGCFSFDGNTRVIYFPLTTANTTIDTFSYNVWFRSRRLDNTYGWRTLIDQDNDNFLLSEFGTTSIQRGWIQIFSPTFDVTSFTFNKDQWYNVSLTHTIGEPFYVYLNGTLIYTSTNNSTVHTTSFFAIGGGWTGSGTNENFLGDIGLAQIYDRKLSSTEVLKNYNATKRRYGL